MSRLLVKDCKIMLIVDIDYLLKRKAELKIITEHERLTLIGEGNILLDKIEHNLRIMFDKIELDDNWETNGWQCDWWWSFEHKGNPFIFSGGIFSSNILISLDTDKINNER